jgi:hypothetical protein
MTIGFVDIALRLMPLFYQKPGLYEMRLRLTRDCFWISRSVRPVAKQDVSRPVGI